MGKIKDYILEMQDKLEYKLVNEHKIFLSEDEILCMLLGMPIEIEEGDKSYVLVYDRNTQDIQKIEVINTLVCNRDVRDIDIMNKIKDCLDLILSTYNKNK
jgi:hypothetical protein